MTPEQIAAFALAKRAKKRAAARAFGVPLNKLEEAVANVGAQPGVNVTEGLGDPPMQQVSPSRAEASMRSGLQGLSFGFGDEGAAGVSAGLETLIGPQSVMPGMDRPIGEAYTDALQRERGALAAGEAAYPWTTALSEIGGAVAAPAAAVGRSANVLGNVFRGAGVGALEGGIYGFGKGEGGAANRGMNAAAMGLMGGIIGGAVPAIANVFRRAKADTPALADLAAIAKAAYKQADGAPAMPRAPLAIMAQDTADELTRRGLDPDLTPQSNVVLDRLMDAATDPKKPPTVTFQELDILRRKAQVPAGNFGNPSEQALGSEVIDRIDDFVDAMSPSLGKLGKDARAMWARMRKSDMILKAMARAQNAASGYEKGLENEFRRILNTPKLNRGLSKAELKALQDVVKGTTIGNFFRQVGKMGIGLGNQSNGLGAMVGSLTGSALMGPAGQVLFPAIGTGAKAITNSAKAAAADRALALIASGGQSATVPARGALMEAALRRAGLSGGQPVAPWLMDRMLQAGQ